MPLNPRKIRVTGLSSSASHGILRLGQLCLPVALGRSGRRAIKREGDGASPKGQWRLAQVLYRADRTGRPLTALPVRAMRPSDGWCDAPADRNYNRAVRLPYPASAEALWRPDDLYDVVVVLDHNQWPRVRGGGSAIFMHVARPGLRPTEGCIAMPIGRLHEVLRRCGRGALLDIG